MIPLTDYITENNYDVAEKIVMAYGYNKPQAKSQTKHALDFLLINKGDGFLAQLADAHPDYALIEERVKQKNKISCDVKPVTAVTTDEKKSNADGRTEEPINKETNTKTTAERKQMFVNEMQKADETTNNFDGTTDPKTDKYIKLIVVTGIVVIATVLICKIA